MAGSMVTVRVAARQRQADQGRKKRGSASRLLKKNGNGYFATGVLCQDLHQAVGFRYRRVVLEQFNQLAAVCVLAVHIMFDTVSDGFGELLRTGHNAFDIHFSKHGLLLWLIVSLFYSALVCRNHDAAMNKP
jgi:hypothetical protein